MDQQARADATTKPAAAADLGAEEPTTLGPNWWLFALRGVFALIFGVLALWMPVAAVFALTLLYGAYALADGIIFIATGVRRARAQRRWGGLVASGVLGILAGLVVLLLPQLASFALATFVWIMFALWAVWTGIFTIASAIRLRKEIRGEWLLGLSGALSVLAGLAVAAVLALLPGAALPMLGLMAGSYALLMGATLLALAWKLRKQGSRPPQWRGGATVG